MMAYGTLEITVISASFSHYASFDSEPNDLYAVLRCNKEQRCTQTAQDQGRLPVWNETLEFNLQQEDISKELVVQVFSVSNEGEELLGTAKIPIQSMVVRDEATLSALIHQHKGETGKLKVAWKWKPDTQKPLKAEGPGKVLEVYEYSVSEAGDVPQKPLKASSIERPGKVPEVYEYSYSVNEAPPKNDFSKLDAVSDSLRKMSLEKKASGVQIAASAPPYVEPEMNYVKSQASELPYPYKAVDSSTPSYPPIQKEDAQQAPWPSTKHTSSATYPSIQESYPSYQSPTSELAAHGNERPYPPLVSSTTLPTYPPGSNDSYPPYDYGASGVYPPPAYTQPYPPPPQDVSSIYPPSYPPNSTGDEGNSYLAQSYPPPLSGAYPPSYPPQQADVMYPIPYPPQGYPASYPAPQGYPASYPPQGYPPQYPPSARGVESVSYDRGLDKDKEKGKGKEHKDKEKKDKEKKDKEKKDKDKKDKDKKDKDKKDKDKKDKEDKHKTHDSSGPYGQPPYYGAPPQGYGAAPPQGYGPGPQGYPPPPPVQGLYTPPPQGYPPMAQPQGLYPPALQPYPAASHGYAPPPPQGYPPSLQGYQPPPQAYHSDPYNVGSSYPPASGYPPHDQPHYATQHGSSSYGGKH